MTAESSDESEGRLYVLISNIKNSLDNPPRSSHNPVVVNNWIDELEEFFDEMHRILENGTEILQSRYAARFRDLLTEYDNLLDSIQNDGAEDVPLISVLGAETDDGIEMLSNLRTNNSRLISARDNMLEIEENSLDLGRVIRDTERDAWKCWSIALIAVIILIIVIVIKYKVK